MENTSSEPAPPYLGAVQPSDQLPNNDSARLSHSLKRLSIKTAAKTPLPPSPGTYSPRRISDQFRTASSPAPHKPPPNAPSRSPSAVSMDRLSSSPALARKGSTSSLRGSETPTTPGKLALRRSSSNLVPSSPTTARSPLAATMEEVPPLTAATVASEYLKRDLSGHAAPDASADAIVLIHDSCYGHRYSRPKTNKSTLSMIVERPERIHASILGVSAAYVRLGERHMGGQNAPHPKRDPTGKLPFKLRKSSRSVDIRSSIVTNVHGASWMQELKGMCDSAGSKLASTGKELSRSYENPGQPDQPAKQKLHEGDLYLCPESLDAFQGALGAVCDGVDAVFEGSKTGQGPSRAFVCIRPPGHHCSSDHPSGFCWLNNVHVGIEHAAQAHGLTHAAIIDFDLHHGDGSQAITWEHNSRVSKMPKNTPNSKKTAIGYFSLHDINSYPCEDGDIHKVQNASLCIENAHGQSIWNVHLQPWKTEKEFWDLYETRYSVLIDKARAFLRTHTERLRSLHNYPQPKAAIFLSAGFDASEWESQGMQRHKVNVPTEFYARFTRDIMSLAREEGTGVDGRVISTLEGGYSDRALMSGVLSHLSGLCESENVATLDQATTNEGGLGAEMQRRLNNLSLNEGVLANGLSTGMRYSTDWWHSSALTALESLVNPTPVAAPTRKPRNPSGGPLNYFTPTQSFTAKAVDPSKLYRTPSGTVRHSSGTTRPPTPPPPEVDWATASYELSRLLIPTDRQTRSCKPEELAEPRVKKERQPVLPADVPAAGGRQLRDRKAKPTNYADMMSEEDTLLALNVTKGNRRKTIADLPLISDVAEDAVSERRPSHSRRRSSLASIGSVSTVAPSVVVATKTVKGSSAKPTANGLQVKKTRRVSGVQPGSSVRDASAEPPVPPVPSTYASKPRRQSPKKERSKPSDDNLDMEQLTSGIKKINIKVPSKEEYEARQAQKAAEEAEKKKAATKPAARKPPTSRTSKATAGTTAKRVSAKGVKDTNILSEQTQPSTVSEMPEPVAPVPAEAPLLMQNGLLDLPPLIQQQVHEAPVPAPGKPDEGVTPTSYPLSSTDDSSLPSSLPLHLPVTDIPGPVTTSSPPNIVPQAPPFTTLQPVFPNSHASTSPQIQNLLNEQPAQPTQDPVQPLQQFPPNADPILTSGPISPARKQKGQLPFFTASGVIPFGSGAAAPAPTAPALPMTEARGRENAPPISNGAVGAGNEERFKDIWEVPETPDKR